MVLGFKSLGLRGRENAQKAESLTLHEGDPGLVLGTAWSPEYYQKQPSVLR